MNIAILVPIYKPELTSDEQTSLRHLHRFFSAYPRILIKPEEMSHSLPGCDVINFPDYHFLSIASYSQLLLSSSFYEAFPSFDYVLIYQLDCLVFSSELQKWCELGYDYIGAPLFEKDCQSPRLSRVGNGGLSLRRVQAFREVLSSPHIPSWGMALTARLPDLNRLPFPARLFRQIRTIRNARRGVQWYASHYTLNEDLFWSDRARLFHPSFKIAPLEVALRFAFDAHPRICFEHNGHQLPFGAHAWSRWDRAFWKPHLLS